MNFWDSSALLPLLIEEKSTTQILDLWEESQEIISWTMTPVEVVSAICRLFRERKLTAEEIETTLLHWEELREEINYIREIEVVKQRAIRLLRLHSLKAADALQLAAALLACSEQTEAHTFVTLDGRLQEAAKKEGFQVRPS